MRLVSAFYIIEQHLELKRFARIVGRLVGEDLTAQTYLGVISGIHRIVPAVK